MGEACRTGKFDNIRNDCFANTTVNILANCKDFYEYIINLERDEVNKKVSTELHDLFVRMKTSPNENHSTRYLRHLFRNKGFDDGQQHCMIGFFLEIIEKVKEEELTGTNTETNLLMPLNPSPQQVYEQAVGSSQVAKMFYWLLSRHFSCSNPDCGTDANNRGIDKITIM